MGEFKVTHKGLMFGMIPVYLDMTDYCCPSVQGRNFLCEIALDVVNPIFGMCVYLMTMVNSDYEPSFPIKITGEL